MKFLNISDIKLKVTLSVKECSDFGIDTSKGDYSTGEIRHAIREILAVAEKECGFSTEGDKILVQLYPLPDGECEILITRLVSMSKRDRDTLASADGISLFEKKRSTYRFPGFAEVYAAVRATRRTDVLCDLYRDDLGRYYLYLEEELGSGISDFEVFTEYGERLSALPIAVLSEYGERIVSESAFDYILSHNSGESK